MGASAGRSGLGKTEISVEVGRRQQCNVGSAEHLQDQGEWVSNRLLLNCITPRVLVQTACDPGVMGHLGWELVTA